MKTNKYFNFSDADFETHLKDPTSPNNARIVQFLTHLAICHTVTQQTIERKVKPNRPTNRQMPSVYFQSYSASSPDELALVNAANFFGVKFMDRPTAQEIVLEYDSQRVGSI